MSKIIELNDLADISANCVATAGCSSRQLNRHHKSNSWIGLRVVAASGPLVYRKSLVQAAGFERVPDDHENYLKLCQKLKAAGKPPGLPLNNAVDDANGFAEAGCCGRMAHLQLLDEEGNLIINSKETVAALEIT